MITLPQLPAGDILVIAGNFIFMVWPFMILSALAARKHSLAKALTVLMAGLLVLITERGDRHSQYRAPAER